jgi:hypothetical protein
MLPTIGLSRVVAKDLRSGEEGGGSADRCTMGSPTIGGSINEMGWRFQSFRANNFELVDQNSLSWNPLIGWLRQIEALRSAA